MNKIKVLAAARHPGPAESIASVVKKLRDNGNDVLLLSVRNDTPETKIHGGSKDIFDMKSLDNIEISKIGYSGDVISLKPEVIKNFFKEYNPDKVIVGCSADSTGKEIGIEEVVLAIANCENIDSVQVLDGWDVWFPKINGNLANRYAAIDELNKAICINRGLYSERIFITGNPSMDYYKTEIKEYVSDKLKLDLDISKSKRILVYFGQAEVSNGSPDHYITLKWVINSMKPSDILIFSKHPRDHRDYSKVLNFDNCIYDLDINSDELLNIADICITHYSTMGLKSAIMNIPTICILLNEDARSTRDFCGSIPLDINGGCYIAVTEYEVNNLLSKKLKYNSDRLKAKLQIDSLSTQRVYDLLLRK